MFQLDLGNLLVHLKLGKGEWDKALREVENTMDRAVRKLDSFGRQMSMKVTAPLVALGTAGVKAFASFDDAMTKSLAIMDNVTPKLRKNMESIAIDLSKETTNSATKIAQGYKFLASAGYDAAQAMEAINAVNQFAIAGNFDLARSTTYIADSMSALGMKMKDPIENMRNMVHISDVLVGANILANAETEQFAASLTNEAGAAMKNWNIKLEEGVAVLAAYADQGIKAEEAGTLFGRMLRLMMTGFQSNRDAWDALNMNIYDATGNLKPLADIVGMLTDKLEGMSTEAKVVALDMLGFEARSQQAILPLLGATERIREYNRRLLEMGGITNKVANENMKSFTDQMRILWNNVVSAARQIGQILAPTILKLNEYIKAGLQYWEGLSESTKETIVQVGLFAVAIGPLAIGLSKLIGLFSGVLSGLTSLISPTGLVIAALVLFAAQVYMTTAVIRQNWDAIKLLSKGVTDAIKQHWTEIALIMAGPVPALIIGSQIELMKFLQKAWSQNYLRIQDITRFWVDSFRSTFLWVSQNVIGPFLGDMVKGFGGAFSKIWDKWTDFLSDLVAGVAGARSWLSTMATGVFGAVKSGSVSGAVSELSKSMSQARQNWAESFSSVFNTVKGSAEDMTNWTKDELSLITIYPRAVEQTVDEFGNSVTDSLNNLGKATMQSMAETSHGLWQDVKNQTKADFTAMFDWIGGQMRDMLADMNAPQAGVSVGAFDTVVSKVKNFIQVMTYPFRELHRQLTATQSGIALTVEQLEKMKRSAIMTEEAIRAAWDKMYAGLDQTSKIYFEYQRKRLEHDVVLWRNNAQNIATTMGVEKQYVLELIDLYEKKQKAQTKIDEALAGNDFFAGAAAGLAELNKQLGGLGKLGGQVAVSLVEGIGGAIADLVTEGKKLSESFRELGLSIANMMIKWATMKLILGTLDMVFPGAGIAAQVAHGGGRLGRDYFPTRFVDESVFTGAVRAHTGLLPGERPVIAKNDETILTPEDMKKMSGGGNKETVALLRKLANRPINLSVAVLDERKAFQEYWGTYEGQREFVRMSRQFRREING